MISSSNHRKTVFLHCHMNLLKRRKSEFPGEKDDNDWIMPPDIASTTLFSIEYAESEIHLWDILLDMYSKLSQSQLKKLDLLILKGIPKQHRARAYKIFTKSESITDPIPYDEKYTERDIKLNQIQIHNDIERTYRMMIFMGSSHNRQRVEDVLLKVVNSDSVLGYAQGMNYFGALITSILNDNDSFWTIYNLFHDKLHNQSFILNKSMEGLIYHVRLHRLFLHAKLPYVFRQFEKLNINPMLYAPQWILTAGLAPAMPSTLVYLILDRYVYWGQRSTHGLLLALIKWQEPIILNAKLSKEIFESLNNIGTLFFEIDMDQFIQSWNELTIPEDEYTAQIDAIEKKLIVL